ncbi:C39 family peptidase [Acinetobacter nosocomialis]|uniref:C39 family peptidase n=1 Tax=Acinetobacter nosocomialis TaxID=106654 RepID=UPI0026EC3CC2|nr:cysteine peptidase family C39 domain-containing protein [Acinetobacter nosocomialis]MDO7219199.1 cysteine peptidase family C39 domain-containing protein [Acinetobacter nosocomialis]
MITKIFFFFFFSLSTLSYSKEIKSFIYFRDYQLVRQSKEFSCGAAALATVMKFHLNIKDFGEQTALQYLTDEKSSLYDLQIIAKEYGISALGLKLSKNEILFIKKPVIAYIKTPLLMDHFVVIKYVYKDDFYIGDPALGNYILKKDEFYKYWLLNNNEGKILYLTNNSNTSNFDTQYFKKNKLYLNRPNFK